MASCASSSDCGAALLFKASNAHGHRIIRCACGVELLTDGTRIREAFGAGAHDAGIATFRL